MTKTFNPTFVAYKAKTGNAPRYPLPPEHIAAAGCAGKQAFTAEEAVKAERAQHSRKGHTVERYRCTVCGAWHIGGTFKASGKRKERGK